MRPSEHSYINCKEENKKQEHRVRAVSNFKCCGQYMSMCGCVWVCVVTVGECHKWSFRQMAKWRRSWIIQILNCIYANAMRMLADFRPWLSRNGFVTSTRGNPVAGIPVTRCPEPGTRHQLLATGDWWRHLQLNAPKAASFSLMHNLYASTLSSEPSAAREGRGRVRGWEVAWSRDCINFYQRKYQNAVDRQLKAKRILSSNGNEGQVNQWPGQNIKCSFLPFCQKPPVFPAQLFGLVCKLQMFCLGVSLQKTCRFIAQKLLLPPRICTLESKKESR